MANAKCNGAGTPGMKSKVVNSPGSPCMANTILIAVSSVRLLAMFIGITKGGTHTYIYIHTYTYLMLLPLQPVFNVEFLE